MAPVVAASANGAAAGSRTWIDATPQVVEKKPAQEPAVAGVQPLRGGDERAVVAVVPELGGGEEEVGVEPGQCGGGQAAASGRLGEPGLPLRGDPVVAHVRRVAQEEGRARGLRQAQRAVVGQVDAGAVRQAGGRQVGAQHERGQRVDVYAVQRGLRELAARGQQVAARAGSGVDDARRPALTGCPADHGADDLRRRVGLPEAAALLRGADGAVGLAQRVLTIADARPDLVHDGGGRGWAPAGARARGGGPHAANEPSLGGREVSGVRRPQCDGEGDQGCLLYTSDAADD